MIHGAGVLEDKLIRHKTSESFERVYATKLAGAATLVERLRDDVKIVVLFSSISGAFGNRGQADYAAAGDALDKLAWQLQQKLSGRVVSIDWGPWAGTGMAVDLAREYARRGIGLIEPEDGVEALLAELRGGRGDAQVILERDGSTRGCGAPMPKAISKKSRVAGLDEADVHSSAESIDSDGKPGEGMLAWLQADRDRRDGGGVPGAPISTRPYWAELSSVGVDARSGDVPADRLEGEYVHRRCSRCKRSGFITARDSRSDRVRQSYAGRGDQRRCPINCVRACTSHCS